MKKKSSLRRAIALLGAVGFMITWGITDDTDYALFSIILYLCYIVVVIGDIERSQEEKKD